MKNNNQTQTVETPKKSSVDTLKSSTELLKSSAQLQSSNDNQVAAMKILAEEIRKGTASLFRKINTDLEDVVTDPSEYLIISNQNDYNLSKDAHISYAKALNEMMTEFTEVTGHVITEAEFDMFLVYNIQQIRKLHADRVTEKCKGIFPESLRKEHEKEYYRSAGKFFQYLILKQETALRRQGAPHFDLRRIRFVDGKATFTEDDADLLLREKFSIDLTDEKVKALMLEFQKLSRQYEKFRRFLEENIPLYGVNPANEPVIGPNGQFIEIHPAKNPQMSLNPYRLSVISNANKGRFMTDLSPR